MSSPEFDTLLSRYADVIVRVGLNVQPGQRLYLRAPLVAAALVRAVARSAYAAGSPLVDVIWGDEQLQLIRLQHAPRDSFTTYADWYVESALAAIERGDAYLAITAETPGLLASQDQEAITTLMQTAATRSAPASAQIQRNAIPWAVAAAAAPGWAATVFPNLQADQQLDQLWQAIFSACRVDRADPVADWQRHVAELEARASYMSQKQYTALRYRGPGTDLSVGLADRHRWAGGGSLSPQGIPFVANLPTEEIFTLPHRARVEGTVRATRPLNYGGVLIDDFSLTFAGGRVSELRAAKGEEVLRRLIGADEGAARLGEVALVPNSSPIGAAGLLFSNTLFDENAACHLAFGRGYRFNLADGVELSDELFSAAGGNSSNIHVDFMIGSGDLDIDGVTADGRAEPVLRRGEWAFAV